MKRRGVNTTMSVKSWYCLFFIFVIVVFHTEAARLSNNTVHKSATKVEETRSLPVIEVVQSIEQPRSNFTGVFQSEYSEDIHSNVRLSHEDEEFYMSWEIAWPRTGKRVDEFIHFYETEQPRHEEDDHRRSLFKNMFENKHRSKRKIYGSDNRYYVSIRSLGRRFPFVSVVKLSTGCTGTLVSPKHVLTAAHCIHNQSDYVEGYQDLSVGILPSFAYGRKFRWIQVQNTFLPNGWLMGNADVASRFDYSLLQLEEMHGKPFFELATSVGRTRRRIHFTAFEDDKPANTLWYRACNVQDTDDHVLYHYCDAKPGSSGAGVYSWLKNRRDGNWQRKLIGVFSGNRWKSYEEYWKRDANYNAAIRLNTLKYTQICGWMGKYAAKSCKELNNSK